MYLFVLLSAAISGCFADQLQVDFSKSFRGGGKYVIRAVASDREGNVYVAGSTEAFDLPVKNAHQARNSGSSITISRDGGRTWEPRGFVPDLPFTHVKAPVAHPQDSRILLARGTHGLYRSTDSGETWTTVIGATTLADTRVFPIGNILFHPADPRVVYAAGSGAVLRSIDAAVSWTVLPVGLEEGNCCLGSSVAVDPFQPSRLIYNTNRKSFLSDNAGASWRLLPVDGNRALFDPSRKGTVYLQQYDVMARSLDSGATWDFLPLNARLMDWMVADPSTPGGCMPASRI